MIELCDLLLFQVAAGDAVAVTSADAEVVLWAALSMNWTTAQMGHRFLDEELQKNCFPGHLSLTRIWYNSRENSYFAAKLLHIGSDATWNRRHIAPFRPNLVRCILGMFVTPPELP